MTIIVFEKANDYETIGSAGEWVNALDITKEMPKEGQDPADYVITVYCELISSNNNKGIVARVRLDDATKGNFRKANAQSSEIFQFNVPIIENLSPGEHNIKLQLYRNDSSYTITAQNIRVVARKR